MYEALTLPRLLKQLEQIFDGFPASRAGRPNAQYEVADAAKGAFAVFFTQQASFLAHQRAMRLAKGRSNAERLFEMYALPSDTLREIRNLLDPVNPQSLQAMYRQVFQALDEADVLTSYRSFGRQHLVVLDGTPYFASKKIHCPQCSQRVLSNGETQYLHSVVTPVLVHPGRSQVLALQPEFIVPQDGHEKQDCEIAAATPVRNRGPVAGWTSTGIFMPSRARPCWAMTCIVASRSVRRCAITSCTSFWCVSRSRTPTSTRLWRFWPPSNYWAPNRSGTGWANTRKSPPTPAPPSGACRYTEALPLTADPQAIKVNWCEVTITREDTGEPLYTNAFVTDFVITDTTVEAVVRDGRTRWKVENENNNVLKTTGYHLEHNFGHGQQYLASLLLSLNLLAFLCHTVLDLVDPHSPCSWGKCDQYRAIRAALGPRRTFFQDLETLLRYFPFENWDAVWAFMFHGLELDTG